MEFFVVLLLLLALVAAGLRWGVDSREPHNNWDRA
jgi:hypothetical protein